jgi:pimeloyl-ACP methyl ester carboxylesterase
MLHGWAMAGEYFDRVAPKLASHYRLLIPDFRSHGASMHCPRGQRIARYACDVKEVLEAFSEGEPFFLLGWSMGASVILSMLDLFPNLKPAGIVLVDQTPFNLNSADWSYGVTGLRRDGVAQLETDVRDRFADFMDGFFPSMFTHAIDNHDLDRLKAVSLKTHPEAASAILVDHVNQDWRDVVRGLSVPTMAIACAHSLAGAGTRELKNLNPQIRVLRYEDCGHCPFFEQPESFAADVLSFLSSYRRPGDSSPTRTARSIRLLAFVVEDLQAAVEQWCAVTGVGPWILVDHFKTEDQRFRGAPSSAGISVAFSSSGDLVISLIEPTDNMPSIYRETVAERGWNCLSHVAFVTANYEQDLASLQDRGLNVVADGKAVGVGGQRFAYLDSRSLLGPALEVIEAHETVEKFFSRVRTAAAGWDGTRPMRRLEDA